ncbi:ribbon-helix-helix protein, CopG family [Candidatus Poribacteria bacterium]|nr:ribbon-helix-helix protein, CopG family [Candidatus Poribacteria bacterium]
MKPKQQQIKTVQDRFCITLPVALANQVRKIAKRENISISFFARQAIEEKLKQMEPFFFHENEKKLSLRERRAFMDLPIEERRKIMAEQAEEILFSYEQDSEWKELQRGDIVEY